MPYTSIVLICTKWINVHICKHKNEHLLVKSIGSVIHLSCNKRLLMLTNNLLLTFVHKCMHLCTNVSSRCFTFCYFSSYSDSFEHVLPYGRTYEFLSLLFLRCLTSNIFTLYILKTNKLFMISDFMLISAGFLHLCFHVFRHHWIF